MFWLSNRIIHLLLKNFLKGYEDMLKTEEEDEGYEEWYVENRKVKDVHEVRNYENVSSFIPIWNALLKTFYDRSDELHVFILNKRIFTLKHNHKSISFPLSNLGEIFFFYLLSACSTFSDRHSRKTCFSFGNYLMSIVSYWIFFIYKSYKYHQQYTHWYFDKIKESM